jgi:hypothetical protein
MAALLQQFGWEYLEHPLHSPGFTPSDFHFLPSEEASWCKFQNITDVQEAVSECFHMQI